MHIFYFLIDVFSILTTFSSADFYTCLKPLLHVPSSFVLLWHWFWCHFHTHLHCNKLPCILTLHCYLPCRERVSRRGGKRIKFKGKFNIKKKSSETLEATSQLKICNLCATWLYSECTFKQPLPPIS